TFWGQYNMGFLLWHGHDDRPCSEWWKSPRRSSTSFMTDSRKMITVTQNHQQISLLFVIVHRCS
ncbi:hypothetical protein, partial [Escherichia coli]|uniref:hypothetical protein n=1 Tax=Escherichia coli TaxID=562 RepID=UPI0022F107AE